MNDIPWRDVFELCKKEKEIFIFGGEQIYNMFLLNVEKIYMTKIHHEFEGDTFFPKVNFDEWKEVSVEKGILNAKNPYNYYFHVYERNDSQNHLSIQSIINFTKAKSTNTP